VERFSEEPFHEFVESREPAAIQRFGHGVENISELACLLARRAHRRYVSEYDVREAIKIRFCSVWPFCRSPRGEHPG
jgi:histone H3/H4